MSTFDTSGYVLPLKRYDPTWYAEKVGYEWADLDPFTQGYVEALFSETIHGDPRTRWGKHYGFSDLAPETLARIMEDCAAYQASDIAELCNEAEGRWLWHARNLRDDLKDFPPLTPHLGDDGKVYLRPTLSHGVAS